MPTAFRLYSKLDEFWGLSGQSLPGGYLKFYAAGTLTAKDVFGEIDLSTNNGSTVDLDASSRPDVDIWGSGSYFVELYDADDVKQGEADDVEIPGGEASTLPELETGEFLTNDGSVTSWAAIREVPDPTGSSGKVLGTDGTDLLWQALAAQTATSDATSFRIGDLLIQVGSNSCAPSGTRSAGSNLAFPVALDELPIYFGLQYTMVEASEAGCLPGWSVVATTTAGLNLQFYAGGDYSSGSEMNITNTITFKYIVVGVKAV